MKVIALGGTDDVGKSTTFDVLRQNLAADPLYQELDVQYIYDRHGNPIDFRLKLLYNNLLIGICSQGDTEDTCERGYQAVVGLHNGNVPDLYLGACKSSGATVNYLRGLSNDFISMLKTAVDHPRQALADLSYARAMKILIENW